MQNMKKSLQYFLFPAIMIAVVFSSFGMNHTSVELATENDSTQNGFYGLLLSSRHLKDPVPDAVNRPLFAELKQQFEAVGWLPETEDYITPRNITLGQIDSLKAIYYPLALKLTATLGDTNKLRSKNEWAGVMATLQDRERSPGVDSQFELASLRPVNLIPIYEYANRMVDFYEQDSLTRNIIDYLKLRPGVVRVVMADKSGVPVTVLIVTDRGSGRIQHACKDYTDKVPSFSFTEQGLCWIPIFHVAFVRNNKLFGFELDIGTLRISKRDATSNSKKDTTLFVHEVYLYDVQNAYNRHSKYSGILSSLKNKLDDHVRNMKQ